MSFSRLNYDDGQYMHNLRESVGPGEYFIATPRVDCGSCYYPSPDVRIDHFGAGKCKQLIDVDSEMMGITRKASNCPMDKFLPTKDGHCVMKLGKDCMGLTVEETRLSNPPCTLRGTGWNRWEWLCQNPQDKVFIPFDYNVNERLLAKDNHRPCISNPIDQNSSLPPVENNNFVPGYKSTCDTSSVNNELLTGPTWAHCGRIEAGM